MRKIGVGLYGSNGHQIHGLLENHQAARLVGVAAWEEGKHPVPLKSPAPYRSYVSLDEMLSDPEVELVSLCSPRRADQAGQAIACLRAGKHVYAEKPCGMTEAEIDAILAVSTETGRQFHEMAGTALEQPYVALRQVVESGVLGEIVQIFAQKSYPSAFERRPQDEDVDGGLIRQNAIHAFRMVEHVAGVQIVDVSAVETTLGNPVADGGLHIAASFVLRLENGGVASVVANYLNPIGMGIWGNEHLRIFGTNGFVESVDGGARTRLVVGKEDRGALDVSQPWRDFFDYYVDHLLGNGAMPFELGEELHPTRMVIRAKEQKLN
ncbi:TPA: hypothetical protein DDW35_09850 [Candidatus Sumerlaeota bacterium]|nr:hypothetical protein [Candidatus Sumerlaeota bacterium]